MKKIIRSVTVRDPKSKWNNQKVDILLNGNEIIEINKRIDSKFSEIKGDSLEIYPGLVDGRTHFFLPGGEQREDWTELISSAKRGGFQAIALISNGKQPVQTPEAIQFIQSKSKENNINLIPVASLTIDNKEDNFTDLYDLFRAGASFFSNGNKNLDNLDIMVKSLQYLAPYPVKIIVQPNTQALSVFGQVHEGIQSTYLGLKGIPTLSESMAIKRDIDLLRYTLNHSFGKVHPVFKLHFSCISSKDSVDIIELAQKEGLPITADVSINHLVFTEESLVNFDVNKKIFPPLRSIKDQKALWKGLKKGVIQYVVSDHFPVEIEHKEVEFGYSDFGSIGLETLLIAFKQKALEYNLEDIANYISYQPASAFGVKINSIEIGNHISAVITEKKSYQYTIDQIKNKAKNSIFIGENFDFNILETIQ